MTLLGFFGPQGFLRYHIRFVITHGLFAESLFVDSNGVGVVGDGLTANGEDSSKNVSLGIEWVLNLDDIAWLWLPLWNDPQSISLDNTGCHVIAVHLSCGEKYTPDDDDTDDDQSRNGFPHGFILSTSTTFRHAGFHGSG